MAGSFIGIAGVQQMQLSGSAPPYGSVPMAGGILTVYEAATSLQVQVFQDIGLTIPAANPMTLDVTGRVPFFFVADGTYRVRLQDASGVITNGGFDLPQVPSIGASTSGGGGSSVDPTTILSTGDVKWQPIQGSITGFVRMNNRTIGSAASGGTERANLDCQNLFLYIWNNFPDTICPVVGGRGATATADWGAAKQITLLDLRARAAIGLDDMGNTASGRLTALSTNTPTTPGTSGGVDSVALTTPQLAVHAHALTDPGHDHTINSYFAGFATNTSGASGNVTPLGSVHPITDSATTGITISNAGAGAAHANMPPFLLGTWFWKL
jgi:microcystin-dependent protein